MGRRRRAPRVLGHVDTQLPSVELRAVRALEALLNERKITEVLKTVEREATSKNLKAAAQAVQFARSISTPVAGQGVANGNGANGGASPSGGGGLFAKKGDEAPKGLGHYFGNPESGEGGPWEKFPALIKGEQKVGVAEMKVGGSGSMKAMDGVVVEKETIRAK